MRLTREDSDGLPVNGLAAMVPIFTVMLPVHSNLRTTVAQN